ncbi:MULTISPECIES: hypothetical protein [unclassified Exiguobacterium]|uniref:hypothetical protein n=1 Tax=unclassified Exiguobacterium TaxID=2644629 RepID=UPI00103B09A5|nr:MULTISPECIES: hypothetical protein [unclassified Exiguobacterium]TCI39795.1 hypothetical protein EVJ29_03925 [Exiguobacterium sp. SH4S7]TCI47513.1 hypothetical protein EVJ31_00280 [Exiguobacterium sp. SH5S32]TCI54396.1 hypothetical protein EVJ25_00280 [Exiguobacterium sp. SH1S4]TCI65098.1 hypothetical protein EVJ21_00430 [Exiguobacterium sp. SH0S2]TCI74190.1 hypothetical protein EVJ23_00280 [Exiguobacterium sp. SH1S1]
MVKRLLVRAGIGLALAAVARVGIQKLLDDRARKEDHTYLEPKWDETPSVDADKDDDEVGLTQLDSIYRAEWQANTYPRSEAERKALEE